MTATREEVKGGPSSATYLQLMQLVFNIISALMRSVVIVIKTLYQLVRPPPAKSLKGEVVLITGTGHGIGKQLALEFWSHGCTVICVDINKRNNNLTVRDINARHRQRLEANGMLIQDGSGPAYAYQCDVTDKSQVAEMAKLVQKEFGRVDILINNAGIMPVQPILQVKPTDVIDVVNVNLLSHFWTLLAFLPGMVERKHGHIVAISSVAGICGLANKVPYSASKFAVAGLMDALSEELRLDSHNIKLTCVHPYFVQTQPDIPQHLDLRIPELSPEQTAAEIIDAIRHDMNIITVPRNLLFWLNLLRSLPQDAREVWRDLFHARVTPLEIQQFPTPHNVESNKT